MLLCKDTLVNSCRSSSSSSSTSSGNWLPYCQQWQIKKKEKNNKINGYYLSFSKYLPKTISDTSKSATFGLVKDLTLRNKDNLHKLLNIPQHENNLKSIKLWSFNRQTTLSSLKPFTFGSWVCLVGLFLSCFPSAFSVEHSATPVNLLWSWLGWFPLGSHLSFSDVSQTLKADL